MQAEGVTARGNLLSRGLEHPQPHEAALRAPGSRLLQRHRAFVASAAVLIVSTVNDHVGDLLACCRDSYPLPRMAEPGEQTHAAGRHRRMAGPGPPGRPPP